MLKEGLWVQVKVDYGHEFSLMLSVQQGLAGFRVRQDRVPFLQTVSRENHRAERIWPEVNQRINYPLKHLLIQMEANQIIDMRDETVKFCCRWILTYVLVSNEKVCHAVEHSKADTIGTTAACQEYGDSHISVLSM